MPDGLVSDGWAGVWLDGRPPTVWRAHSDGVNARLVEAWLPGDLGAVLKTDLFDEAVSAGLLPGLAARARSVAGIDIEPRIVEAVARRLPGLETVAADIRALPFPDASFDTVFSNSTLDHFDDAREIEASLHEIARVMARGGRLLVTLDNPRNPFVAVGKALRSPGLNRLWARRGALCTRIGLAPYHVGATLDTPALVKALGRSGLSVVRTGYAVHAPRLAAVVAGSVVERNLGTGAQRRFAASLEACESVGRLPTRRLTAHFVVALAVRR